MKNRIGWLVLGLMVCGWAGLAQAQVRVVSYNTLSGPNSTAEDALAQTIFGAVATTDRNGIAKRPDIIGLQEQTTSGSNTASRLAGELNELYGVTSYQATMFGGGSFKLAYVYDSATVDLVSQANITVGIRPGHRVLWQPVGYTSADPQFYTYNVHFKAGTSGSDATQRANEATNLRSNADALGPDQHIIYLGDFNLGDPTESGYTNLTAGGNGQAVDPINLTNWAGLAGALHHTQSTRDSQLSDGGSPGGMDDRFDLQLMTSQFLDGEGLSYIGPTSAGGGSLDHSYQAFGNDGNTFNQAINDNTAGRSQSVAVLNALHDLSDHLPVVADYQLPARLNLTASGPANRVIVGAGLAVNTQVANTAPVTVAAGADELDYDLSASGDVLNIPVSGTVAAAGSADASVFAAFSNTAGAKTATFTATTSSEGAAIENGVVDFNFTVVDHANGSFEAGSDVNHIEIDFGTIELGANGGAVGEAVRIYNLEDTLGFTSDLIVGSPTAVSGDTAVLGLLDLPGTVAAGSSLLTAATLDTSVAGTYAADWQITVSDEAIAGGTSSTLTLSLLGEVVQTLAVLGDFDDSGTVEGNDLTLLLTYWNQSEATAIADANWINDDQVDGSGLIDAGELTPLLLNWNTSALSLEDAVSLVYAETGLDYGYLVNVPEPGGVLAMGLGGLCLLFRRRGPGGGREGVH